MYPTINELTSAANKMLYDICVGWSTKSIAVINPAPEIIGIASKNENFANWYYEKHFLGYSYYTTLEKLFKVPSNLREVENALENDGVRYAGWVEDAAKRKSKNGNAYQNLIISDERGEMKTMIFTKRMEACEENNGRLPRKGDIVIVKGTKKDGVVFANHIDIPNVKIYTKLSELKG